MTTECIQSKKDIEILIQRGYLKMLVWKDLVKRQISECQDKDESDPTSRQH